MPNEAIVPIHIIVDEAIDLKSLDDCFSQALDRLTRETKGSARNLRLSVTRLATTWNIKPGQSFIERGKQEVGRRVHGLFSALADRVARDYTELESEGVANPRILLLLESASRSWLEPWTRARAVEDLRRVFDQFRPRVIVYWIGGSGPGHEHTDAWMEELSTLMQNEKIVVNEGQGIHRMNEIVNTLFAEVESAGLPASLPADSAEPVSGVEGGKLSSEPANTAPAPPDHAALWKEKEPPEDAGDEAPHVHMKHESKGPMGCQLYGVSQRGRLHAHEGTFREDYFHFDVEAGWCLVAVADGAGSRRLSRVGSKLATKRAVEKMRQIVTKEPPSQSTASAALQQALRHAWNELHAEASKRSIERRDLGTTLLLLAYKPRENLVAVAQVGDGLLAAQLVDGHCAVLGHPESGEYAGETVFLTDCKPNDLLAQVKTLEPPAEIALFMVMTDGIADDLYPHEKRLPVLVDPLGKILSDREAGPDAVLDQLHKLIQYERAGSFDDRTLVVLCRPEALDELPPLSDP